MSRIDDLIRQYCPAGVATRPIGDLGEFFGGLSGKSKVDFEGGNARYVTYMNVFSNPATHVESEDRVKVADGERQRRLRLGDILFTGSSESLAECGISSVVTREPPEPTYLNSFCIGYRLADLDLLDPEFAKHLFRSTAVRHQIVRTANGVTRFNVSKARLANVAIPLPPLEVQREIVRVLDMFQSLEAELEAELEARRLQHAHYRDSLLSPAANHDKFKLGDLLELIIDHRGKTPSKLGGTWVECGHRVISALNFSNGEIDLNDHHYIDDEIFSKWMRNPLKSGDVLLTSEAPLGAVAYVGDDSDWALGQRVFGLRPRIELINGRYLYHLLAGGPPRKELLRRATGSTVLGIRQAELVKIEIRLPSLEVQAAMASTLDKFDALVNDISIGLPAELAARRSQYEYYRDRLLTFEEAA